MLKKKLAVFILMTASMSAFAANSETNFVILPNIHTQYMMSTNASKALNLQKQAIDLVKKAVNTTSYKTIRIRFIYNTQNQVESLIVYLLSSKYKSFELVKIDVNSEFQATNVIQNYKLKLTDLTQAPENTPARKPRCPDKTVEFVIGNNFDGDTSVEKEVQAVYNMANAKGYKTFLMNVNDPASPQPTVSAYENWMTCPNVKAFYNEAHGSNEEILLSDGDFTYALVDKFLVNKLQHDVLLFDSCSTFNDPLLSSMVSNDKGNAQQYVAGFIPLPFGASERTASCFWAAAMDQQPMSQNLIEECGEKFGLEKGAFRIGGHGEDHLRPAG